MALGGVMGRLKCGLIYAVGVSVSAYGSMMPLKQSRQCWHRGCTHCGCLRLTQDFSRNVGRGCLPVRTWVWARHPMALPCSIFPELSSERREQMVKHAKESSKRRARLYEVARESWKRIQGVNERALTEDDKFKLKEDLQKKISTTNDDLEKMFD